MKQNSTASVLNSVGSVNIPYQLVIFDFDGTLCQTQAADIYAIQKTYQALHQSVPSSQTIQAALSQGFIIQSIFQNLSPEATATSVEKLVLTYKRIYPTHASSAELFPGVIALLDKLTAANLAIIIVSNKASETLQSALKSLRIENYFDMVIGVQANGICKPDSRLYTHYIAPRFPAIPLDKVLMVGDTSTDLRFSANIGVDACWARYGLSDPTSCQALQPTHTIQQVSDLRSVIFPSV